jgi:hypothetical protein
MAAALSLTFEDGKHQDAEEQLRTSDGVHSTKPGISEILDASMEEASIRRHSRV